MRVRAHNYYITLQFKLSLLINKKLSYLKGYKIGILLYKVN
jgi:hypothetical protein